MQNEKQEYVFRSDDIERKEAAEFNIEASKRILSLAGIDETNPDYKKYFALTARNVHSTFLYATYNDTIEEMFVSTLKTPELTVDQYEQITEEYYKSIIEREQEEAIGGFAGAAKYDALKSKIDTTVLSGIQMRETLRPDFPKQFYDEEGKIRPRVVVEIPYEQQEESALGMISSYASLHNGISFDRSNNVVLVNGKPIGPEKFFKNKREFLDDKFLGKLGKDENLLDMDDKELFDILRTGTYKDFLELRKARGMAKDKRNDALRGAIADECIFVDLQQRMELVDSRSTFLHQIKDLAYDYEAKAMLVRREAEKDTLEIIDRVLFSISPYDIATQSTFRAWKSCMNAVGCNHRYVDDAIGIGSIVAYGYDSKNPRMMVSRLLIQPYENERKEFAYKVNPRIYGHENIGFRNVVNSVVENYFNEGKEGYFVFNRDKPSDSEGYLYNDGGTEPFVIVHADENGTLDLTKFEDVFEFDLSQNDVDDIKKVKSKGRVVAKEFWELDNIDLSEVGELVLPNVSRIGENVKLPKKVTVAYHIPVNADFREVEDMQIRDRILLTDDMLLPNKIGVETGAIIEGTLLSCLSFDEKGKYGFKNIFVADEGVNILGEVECYGIIKPDLDFSNAESVVLNHVTSASKNMKLGKNVTCEGFVPEGLDFSNVENLVFKGVAYDGKGKNLPPVVLCHGEVSGDFSDFEKIILDAKTSSQGIIKFPKEVQFNKEVYGDLERVDTDHIILNNVYYMAASRVSSVDKVTCIGSVPYGIDLSKVGTLELKEHIKFGENVVVPSNVVLEDGVTLEGYLPNGLDLSKQSEVVIDGLNGLGENVKLPEKVIINKSILGDVDLSGVDTLVLRDVETMPEGVKLPKVVEIEGKNPFVGNDFHGVETVIVSDDMVMFYADKLPEHLIYHGSKCSISKNIGVKILETDAKSIGMIPDEVEKLILTEKEILWNNANVSCDVEFVDGLVLSGHSIYDLDLSEVKDLTLREFVLNDKIKLPSSFRVEDKSVITYELDLSGVEELTLAGSVKLEGSVKLPENVKFEDGIVLSGSIPDGLDLSNVKGLVFAEDVRIGEDVKLPDDVKFEDGIVVSGNIPSNTDLSGVSNLTVGGYACFGENVRLPEDVKFKSSSGQCSLKGYIPKEADLTKVSLDEVYYTSAVLRCDIPDGADLSDCSSLVFEGDVHFGKDVKLKYGTIEECTNARFFGDVYATEKMLDADFSHASSLVISGSPCVISSDMKLPENNNVSIEDGFVLADSLEAINKIANCKIDDVLVGYMGNSLPEGSCISDKIPMLAFFDQETATALIIADGENKEKAIDIVSSIGDGEISITHMTKEEFSSKTGVKFGSKEEKVDGILARVRGKLNNAKAADGAGDGAGKTSNQGKTGTISRDDFQM